MIHCKLTEQIRHDTSDGVRRVDRAVSGETLSLGRAASCKVYLPDPRVRLDHALIRRAENGHLYLDAAGPTLVNQQPQTSVRLELGQAISIGPFDFIVEALQDDSTLPEAQITLAYAIREAAQQDEDDEDEPHTPGPRDGWVTRRRLSWLLSLLVIGLCAALPIWHAHQPSGPPAPDSGFLTSTANLDRFWNPGPVSSAHQTLAQDCRACHAKPFERVTDASCLECHKTVGAHIADKRIDDSTFKGERCATCHKEHQGSAGMRQVAAVGCAQCHGSIGTYSPLTALSDISDFARDHPPFRLSIRHGKDAKEATRVAQTPELKNDPGLKFPHDIHLARAGIKSPTGPAATGGRVVLDCASCHTLDAASARYEPVRMDRHCQSCHQLSVDPQAPDRQVPHAKPETVRTAVREIYASLAVDRFPVSLVTVNSLLQRPGAEAPAERSVSASLWVQEQSEHALSGLLDKPKGACRICHEVKRQGGASGQAVGWEIAPVVASNHWLPKARFAHNQHENAQCADCHQAGRSASSSDILVPSLKDCQVCHAGVDKEPKKVVSLCESCHVFHGKTLHPAFDKNVAGAEGVR